MSNYSYDLIDEDKLGLIDFLIEGIEYPIQRADLEERLTKTFPALQEVEMKGYIDHLLELEIFLEKKTDVEGSICLITSSEKELKQFCEIRLQQLGYTVKHVTVNEVDPRFAEYRDGKEAEMIRASDVVVLISKHFRPSLFYQINALCLELDKPFVIAYLDGDEGLIVPVMNPKRTGCYNDFELLRESSFFNLLDYQVMKEACIASTAEMAEHHPLHLEALINQTILLVNHLSKNTTINHYAYSLDFERMVNTKIRLLKFPKCPSCQGDKNITHPFI